MNTPPASQLARSAPNQQPTPLDLRIEALAVAGTAHGLSGVLLTNYVVAHCLDVLRERVVTLVDDMRECGRIS